MKSLSVTKLLETLGRRLKPTVVVANNEQPRSMALMPIQSIDIERKPAAMSAANAPTRSKYYLIGKDVARRTRALKVDPVIFEALKEQVMADAASDVIANFDPVGNLIDQRTLAKLEACDARLEGQKDDREMAAAELRRRRDELANSGALPCYPSATPLFQWTATNAITISVAPTIYSFFGGLFPPLKWILAIGFGGGIALLIVLASTYAQMSRT